MEGDRPHRGTPPQPRHRAGNGSHRHVEGSKGTQVHRVRATTLDTRSRSHLGEENIQAVRNSQAPGQMTPPRSSCSTGGVFFRVTFFLFGPLRLLSEQTAWTKVGQQASLARQNLFAPLVLKVVVSYGGRELFLPPVCHACLFFMCICYSLQSHSLLKKFGPAGTLSERGTVKGPPLARKAFCLLALHPWTSHSFCAFSLVSTQSHSESPLISQSKLMLAAHLHAKSSGDKTPKICFFGSTSTLLAYRAQRTHYTRILRKLGSPFSDPSRGSSRSSARQLEAKKLETLGALRAHRLITLPWGNLHINLHVCTYMGIPKARAHLWV